MTPLRPEIETLLASFNPAARPGEVRDMTDRILEVIREPDAMKAAWACIFKALARWHLQEADAIDTVRDALPIEREAMRDALNGASLEHKKLRNYFRAAANRVRKGEDPAELAATLFAKPTRQVPAALSEQRDAADRVMEAIGRSAVLTEQERKVMRHALGLDRSKESYRNHYAAAGPDVAIWEDLTERGFASRAAIGACIVTYKVTDAGRDALSEQREADHG